jgi:hypothetical protein
MQGHRESTRPMQGTIVCGIARSIDPARSRPPYPRGSRASLANVPKKADGGSAALLQKFHNHHVHVMAGDTLSLSRKVRLQPPHTMCGLGQGVGLGAVIPAALFV